MNLASHPLAVTLLIVIANANGCDGRSSKLRGASGNEETLEPYAVRKLAKGTPEPLKKTLPAPDEGGAGRFNHFVKSLDGGNDSVGKDGDAAMEHGRDLIFGLGGNGGLDGIQDGFCGGNFCNPTHEDPCCEGYECLDCGFGCMATCQPLIATHTCLGDRCDDLDDCCGEANSCYRGTCQYL